MKREVLTLIFVALMATAALGLKGQDANSAAIIAERQDMEERYKRLSSAIDALQAADVALQKQIAGVAAEVRELRELVSKQPTGLATQDDVKRVAEKLVEVDKKREDNNKLVLEKMAELAKTLTKPPPTTPRTATPRPPKPETATPATQEKGIEYTVQSGDTISKIIEAYRKENIKVTQKQIEDANPGLKPTKLQVGQKIWIPVSN
jgi:hypothetical protein